MNTLSSTLQAHEARDNFYQILDETGQGLRQFVVTLRGQAKAVIMSAEEYDGWLETLDVMSDKRLVTDIRRGVKELKTGKGVSWEIAKKKLKI